MISCYNNNLDSNFFFKLWQNVRKNAFLFFSQYCGTFFGKTINFCEKSGLISLKCKNIVELPVPSHPVWSLIGPLSVPYQSLTSPLPVPYLSLTCPLPYLIPHTLPHKEQGQTLYLISATHHPPPLNFLEAFIVP